MNKFNNHFLFVGGAPRSGTTYLFDLLATHSQIMPARGRESYFFMDEAHPLRNAACNIHQNSLQAYLNHFFPQASTVKYLLDGTDHLLYQMQVRHQIAALPHKKMVFIFREPAQRIFSSFQYSKNNLGYFKKDLSFERYVQCLLEKDHAFLQTCLYNSQRNAFVLQRELEYSHYYPYLEAWFETIGREHIYLLQFESFIKAPDSTLQELYTWLELPAEDTASPTSLQRNQSVPIRHPRLHYWSRQLARLLPTSDWKDTLREVYFMFQKKKTNMPPPTSQQALQGLKKHFAESNARLAALMDIDLELW